MKIAGLGVARRLVELASWSPLVPNTKRGALLSRLGYRGFENAMWSAGSMIVNPAAKQVAEGAFINAGVYMDAGPISIGQNVAIGPRCVLVTGNHSMGPSDKRAADGEHAPIAIGDGAWLGAGVIVLPGVTIGAGCVVAAGAVVTKDCVPNGLYAGVPATRIKELP